MQILELVVIGSQDTDKEKFYSLLTKESPRSFKGMDFGKISFDSDHAIFIYFFNEEQDPYFYMWDVVIPHAAAILVVCDNDPAILRKNIKTINFIDKKYATPFYICAYGDDGDLGEKINESDIELTAQPVILQEKIVDKESVKRILLQLIPV